MKKIILFVTSLFVSANVSAGWPWDSNYYDCMRKVKNGEDKYFAQHEYCSKKFPEPAAKPSAPMPDWTKATIYFDEKDYPASKFEFEHYFGASYNSTFAQTGFSYMLPIRTKNVQARAFLNCNTKSFKIVGVPKLSGSAQWDMAPDDPFWGFCRN